MAALDLLLRRALRRVPGLRRLHNRLYNDLVHRKFRGRSAGDVFAEIHRTRHWNGPTSASGTGSDLAQTAVVRAELPRLVRDLGIRSLLDIPCGDFFWMRAVDLDLDSYVGGDVVAAVVQRNAEREAAPRRRFVVLDVIRDDLPSADLVLCRDCLVHFSYDDATRALRNIKRSGSRYLLTTTFPAHRNREIVTGNWRPLNLEASPFRLPPPIRIINEACTEGGGVNADKGLGLWKLEDVAV